MKTVHSITALSASDLAANWKTDLLTALIDRFRLHNTEANILHMLEEINGVNEPVSLLKRRIPITEEKVIF
jgi:gamma-glutamyl phosphate reductase